MGQVIAAVVHYNTPELTRALVRSIRKWCGDAVRVVVFENSDRLPYVAEDGFGVEVLQNGGGQLVDFEKELAKWPDKDEREAWNRWGSARHMLSIDWLVRNLDLRGEKGFLLLDSDVLLRKSIVRLAEEGSREGLAWVGERHWYEGRDGKRYERLWPMLCWIGAERCRKAGVRYFNGEWCWALTTGPGQWWDTGAWFLAECDRRGLKGKRVNIGEYIIHLGASSYRDHGVLCRMWLDMWGGLWK